VPLPPDLQVLQRKRRRESLKKRSLERSKAQAQEYHKLLVQRLKEQRERRSVHTTGQLLGSRAGCGGG
jgi:small subunit ribosomal protein S6e